jgi:hypothetical protein
LHCPIKIEPQCRWLVAAAVTLLSAAVAARTDDSGGDIERLILDLGSRHFAVRQRASSELVGAEVEAVPHIAAAVGTEDVEVRQRAAEVLLAQAFSNKSEVRKAARGALVELSQSSVPRIAQAGQEMRRRMAGMAMAELTRLGATVMPVQGTTLSFNVQIGQTWTGGNEGLAMLADLGQVPWLSLESAPVSDLSLTHVAKLADSGLTRLFLGSSGIRGEELTVLAPLKSLQYLSLKQLPIDDARLAALPEFPDLQYLGLDGTRITDRGLAVLGRYPQLQVLWLDNAPVSDAGLVHLKSLVNLRTLYLPGTKVAGPGIAELRQLPNLTSISFRGVRLTADTAKYIGQLEQLESLGLDQTNVNDDQLADLKDLSRLRILWLSSTQITDQGLEHLKALKNLQIVHLSDTEVTREGATELQRSLPNCQVTTSGRAPQAVPQPRNPQARPPMPASP